jgi:Ca2+-binding RTX toxin-like protein
MRKRLIITGVTMGAALFAGVMTTTPAWADDRLSGTVTHGGYTCRGQAAVLADPEPGEDTWWAPAGVDAVVVAFAADVSTVITNYGDDLVCVYPDPREPYHGVLVQTNDGNDTVVTYGGGYNEIELGAGADIAYLNGYEESVWGGTGNDHVWGLGSDEVYLHGDAGTDMLQGSPAADHLWGGDDGDLLIGAGGNDILDGEGGNDSIQGGAGFDTIDGGANTDTCTDTFGLTTFISCETTANAGPGGVTT